MVMPQRVSPSFQTRRTLLRHLAPRYQQASPAQKTLLLDSFVEWTGYTRKYAIALLNHGQLGQQSIQRHRLPKYGPAVQQALFLAWKATHYVCAKRLLPSLPSLVALLEGQGHLQLTEEERRQLLAMSLSTAERFLRTQRKPRLHGLSTTPGPWCRAQIPVRVFSPWEEDRPGFVEVVLIAAHLRQHGVLSKMSERVRFARRRFGHYEVIDFLAVLFGYAISGERTLEAFYERLRTSDAPFMALFGRDQLPARSTLSRFLTALTAEPIDALRILFLEDLESRPLSQDKLTGGLVDRAGNTWVVFDVDGTREAARQRALPQTEALPAAFRRLDDVCAPGYTGRKRGQVVRTRTVVSQAHTYQWLGTFGNRGNGSYRVELRKALAAIARYLTAHQLPKERTLLRLDGQYGTGAILSDLAGFAFVTRGKEYSVLDHPLVQARLHLLPDQVQQRPESQVERNLYDCPEVPMGAEGISCRVVVATHPAGKKKSPVGLTRAGVVYELFFSNLPQQAFTAADVVELYLHRGAFEPALSDEDQELDPDRWCSHSAWGQECWQMVSQWVWNLRLEVGHQLLTSPLRTTEFAPAVAATDEQQPPIRGYGKPTVAIAFKVGRFSGQDFTLQPDGTLRCPANQTLSLHERRKEADGSLRLVYGASIHSCRPCPLREQCQWNGAATAKPRQVSVLLHPLPVGSAPVLWRDWSRREHRRACMQLVRHQRIEVSLSPPAAASSGTAANVILSRAQRAHSRLSWQERLARNARPPTAGHVTIKLFGTLCCLPRVDDGLTARLLASGFPLLGHLRHSEWHPMAFFPGSSSSSAFLAPHPADSSLSHRINVQF